jgi:hypothetical protein
MGQQQKTIALRTQTRTPKHIRSCWSHTDTSKSVVGCGVNEMVTQTNPEVEPTTF